MTKSRAIAGGALGAALLCAAVQPPPPTKAEPVTDTVHGVQIVDPYRWLEDQNSPATRTWIDAQSQYARAHLDALQGRDAMRKKFESLARVDTIGAPSIRNGRYFFTRRLASEDRTSLMLRQGPDGKEEVLVDPKTATDEPSTSLLNMGASEDGTLMAYGTRRGGEDEVNVRFVEVGTRKVLTDSLPRARYTGLTFKPDNSGLYYGKFTIGVGTRVFFHAMGTPASNDKELFGSAYGPNEFISVRASRDGRWLVMGVFEGVPTKSSEIWVQDLSRKTPAQRILKERGEYGFDFADNALYMTTNDKTPNGKVLRVDLLNPAKDRWKEVVPEGPQAIERLWLSGGRLLVSYLENVQTRVKQFDGTGKYLGDLKLPGIGSVPSFSGRWGDPVGFYNFTSFTEPGTWHRVNIATGRQDVWFRPKLPLDTQVLETKQVWFTSKDGTKVPMFLVYRKGIALDGSRPTLMTAYGGFNVSETPGFSNYAAWWAASGGVYALPNLRGGGEFGEKWHEAGMFERKQNVFDDFIAAGQWLFDNKYTRPANLAVMGSSNGGLLMGAMMTQRPDMFNAILCGAPLLDMLRYQNMLVGRWWATEYGSADDPKQFPYLHKYSPYHNVRAGTKFPAILFYTGDADTRVDPSHARKMTALVQAANASENPILLRYDVKGGHSGQGNVNQQLDEQVDRWSFIASRTGLKVE